MQAQEERRQAPALINYRHVLEQRGDRFKVIKRFFNHLNQDSDHFVNSNDICTPLECVKEMVDAIPHSFWRRGDLKVLAQKYRKGENPLLIHRAKFAISLLGKIGPFPYLIPHSRCVWPAIPSSDLGLQIPFASA